MKIRWLESGKYEAVTGVDGSTGEPIVTTILVKAGDETEVDLIKNNNSFRTTMIKFVDGTVLYGVPQYTFQTIA